MDRKPTAGEFDVTVVGGGAAGVAAAVGAAASGARVCLLERHGYLGGAAVAGSVLTYCGFFDRSGEQVVAGVGARFLARLDELDLYRVERSRESGNTVVLLDLETTKRVLDSLVIEAGVEVRLQADAFAADAERDGRVTGLRHQHAGGHGSVTARAFVDCSGDGALLHAVGARSRVEPPERRQASTLVMRVGGVAEDADLDQESIRRAVQLHQEQTGIELGRDRGPAVRLPVTREVMVLIADQHRDMLDVQDATAAGFAARRDAHEYAQALRRHVKGWERSFLAATGPEIGVRETRHLIGRDSVTGEDVAGGRRRPGDVVARGGWPMEDHSVPGSTSYVPVLDDGSYDIPLGSLRSASHRNLWAAGRLLSCDDRAYSSARVMGTAFGTGHAAGVAAARFADTGDESVAPVQAALRAQGALL